MSQDPYARIEDAHQLIRAQMPNYRRLDDAWDSLRVKAKGMEYLPNAQAIVSVTGSVFETYIQRAIFPEVPPRVLSSFIGMAFRKPIHYQVVTLDRKTAAQNGPGFLDDADLLGNSLEEFSKQLLADVIRYGWVVLYCDYSSEFRRPFLRKYVADEAFNWAQSTGAVNHVRLSEGSHWIDPMTFEEGDIKRVRTLDLLDGAAHYRLFEQRESTDGTRWELVEGPEPLLRREQPIPYLPVIPISTYDTGTWWVETSVIMPLVNMIFSAYQTSADLEIARHQCRIIQPIMFGVNKKQTQGLVIGDGSWWSFDTEGSAMMLEADGSVCRILQEAFAEKMEQAAAHGARFLRERKRDAETAEAKRIEESSEVSVLQSIIHNVSEAMRLALIECEEWNAPLANHDAVEFTINDELFEDGGFDPAVFTALKDSWMGGIAPHAVPAQYLVDHGFTDLTPEQMLAAVKTERPELFMEYYRKANQAEDEEAQAGQEEGPAE